MSSINDRTIPLGDNFYYHEFVKPKIYSLDNLVAYISHECPNSRILGRSRKMIGATVLELCPLVKLTDGNIGCTRCPAKPSEEIIAKAMTILGMRVAG